MDVLGDENVRRVGRSMPKEFSLVEFFMEGNVCVHEIPSALS